MLIANIHGNFSLTPEQRQTVNNTVEEWIEENDLDAVAMVESVDSEVEMTDDGAYVTVMPSLHVKITTS